MEHYKIYKSINDSTVSTSVAKKWIAVNVLLGGQNSASKNIKLKNPVVRSDLCDYCEKERISERELIMLTEESKS